MQRSSNIGGQAVMEGIMMRHKDKYSIAVRKPDKEIEIKIEDYKSVIPFEKLGKLPICRGIYSFVDSLVVGTKCLMYSAQFFDDEEPREKKQLTEEEEQAKKKKDEKVYKVMMTFTVIFSVVLSIGLFVLLPYFVAGFLRKVTDSNWIITAAEAFLRIAIFLLYMLLISRMEDIQRLFMYHGAEHKCINCLEHGMDLNVENVLKNSRLHKRCGTSFLLIVMVVSIIFFFFLQGVTSPVWKVVLRILLMPVVAGVAYEFIRLAGRSDSRLVGVLSKPGLALQRLTTKEPAPDMVEVAIKAVEAVFDWEPYVEEVRREIQ